MPNKKIQAGFMVLAIAVLLASTSSVYAYKGLFSFGGDKKESQSHDKPSPLYQGVIAPSSDPNYKRRTPQKQKANPNLETYTDFQKEQAKKDAEKKRQTDQRKKQRDAELLRQEERKRAQANFEYQSSKYIDINKENVTSGVEPISEEARDLLTKRPVRIKGMSTIEYAMRNQIDSILKEVNNPRLSEKAKVKAKDNARRRLLSLVNGIRIRESVSDEAYRGINLPENIIKDKREGSLKALKLIRKEIERLDRR